MITELSLTLLLGLGQPVYKQDFNRELPAKVELSLQLIRSVDYARTLNLSLEHISDASNGEDWGSNTVFLTYSIKLF